MAEAGSPELVPELDVTIITGMSGAGRSAAADVLEDLGLLRDRQPAAGADRQGRRARAGPGRRQPLRLGRRHPLGRLHDRSGDGAQRVARHGRSDPHPVPRRLGRRPRAPLRRHPPPAPADRYRSGVRGHHPRAGPARGAEGAGRPVVDTSDLNVHELRDRLRELFGESDEGERTLQTSIVSFGYKHGLPLDVDLVFDCRFLPNPHWVEALRPLPGTDPKVRRLRHEAARDQGLPGRARAPVRACCSPHTSARARRTCRSASAAPVGTIAAW